MPLLKLWNSIRSARKKNSEQAGQSTTSPAPTLAEQTAGAENSMGPNSSSGANRLDVSSRPAKPTAAPPKKAGRLATLLTGGPHAQLTKQLRKLNVNSILEVGVGDGDRALAVIDCLQRCDADQRLRYVAVDQFEVSGSVPLREFHKQLRTADVNANLIPMPTAAGLDRVARTYGQMDLILWDDESFDINDAPLDRLCSPEGVVFCCQEGQWVEHKADIGRLKAA